MLITKREKKLYKIPAVYLLIVARFLAASYIIFNPLWGLIISIVFDAIDAQVWIRIKGISREEYSLIDKKVDLITYFFMLVAASLTPYLSLLILLLAFRLIGQFIYLISKREIYLLLFPNIFEVSFFIFVSLRTIAVKAPINSVYIWISIIIFSLGREILLHLLWPEFLKRKGYTNYYKF